MKEAIIRYFSDFPGELATFFISMMPVTELRVSIPVAINRFGLTPVSAWWWSVLGTFSSMLLILFLLEPVSKFLSKYFHFFDIFFKWLFRHTREGNSAKMKRFGEWAILILAATPVPLLGGLTGALAAFVFGIDYRRAIPLLLIGTMLSGFFVLYLTVFISSTIG